MKGEDALQAACVEYFRYQYPHDILFSIPNGSYKSPAARMIFKKTGLLKGVPDLFLAKPIPPFGGLFIEMKQPKGSISPNQKEMGEKK